MSQTPRLFVAVPVTEEVREAACRLIEDLRRAGADYKWVDPENLHLTLYFFGATPLERVAEIEAVLRQAARRPSFEISFSGVGAFSSWEHPKVVWVGVTQGERELASLAEAFGPAEEGRPFSAHLTIGRMRGPRGLQRLKESATKAEFQELRQKVDRIALFESCLSSKGPVYSIRKEESLEE